MDWWKEKDIGTSRYTAGSVHRSSLPYLPRPLHTGDAGRRCVELHRHADVCVRFRNPSCGSMCPNRGHCVYARHTADGNAPVRPGGSTDMSDRGGAMRGWAEPVRYGLIRPLSVRNGGCPCSVGCCETGTGSGGVRPLCFGNSRPCFVPYRTAGCIRDSVGSRRHS